jgi:hypothetical protein
MSSTWRTVRVFISSTFRDMHAERDWLVQRVFPALRERLEPYRVHLVDIDLRWGVTEDQANNDEVLGICLSQIHYCRPFFLGMLGERYGWVTDKVPESVTSNWDWVRHHLDKSITELEILHGVLNNPDMQGHSLFCFRDPAFLKDVPADRRADLEPESPEHLTKLNNLKQAVRESKLPLMENYPCRFAGLKRNGTVKLEGLEEFGRRVFDWLWDSIRREKQLPDAPQAAADADPLAEEQDHHERFMESRLRVYIGRDSLQQSLAAFADGNEELPCLVTGPSGSGKSAALARFATEYAARHPGALVIPHFVGASPASTGLRSMLLRFCSTLKREFQLAEEVPPDTNGLVTAFRQFLEKVPADRRVVLVVDALNQLDEADNAQRLTWLPWKFPTHVKLIASCIADPGREEPVLQAFANRPHRAIPVEALTPAERQAILKEVPSLSAKTLDEVQVSLLLANPATANPLFLLVALEELRGFGSFEQLDPRISEFPHAIGAESAWPSWLAAWRTRAEALADVRKRQALLKRVALIENALQSAKPVEDTVTELFRQVIERLENGFDSGAVRSMLSLLASARRGLSDRELLDLVEGPGVATEQSASDLFPVLRQLRTYLQHRGRLWDFFHRNLFKAVRDYYLRAEEDRSAAHARLAAYFKGQDYFLESLEEQRARAKRLPPTPRPANVRKVDELPYQLLQVAKLSGKDDAKSPHWDAVADLFTDLHFLEAKAEAVA